MFATTFGRINNGNTAHNMEDRTKPILNLLSTSYTRAQMENERTSKNLDPPSLQHLKLPKRLDKNNSRSDQAADPPLLLLQPQRRLLSQVPPHSAPYRKSEPTTPSPVVSLDRQKTIDNTNVSSPFLMSQESDDRAYNNSNRQRPASPDPQASFRLSSLKRPDTHTSSTRAGPEYSTRASRNQQYNEAYLLEQVNGLFVNKHQLQSKIDELENLHSHASRELKEHRSRLASTMSQLESANSELVETRTSLISATEKLAVLEGEHRSMTASFLEAKSELGVVNGDRERLREAHAQDRAENDQLRKRVEASKKAIAVLRERCDGRDMDFALLKKAHDGLCFVIENAKKEADESKNLANNALTTLEPLIDCGTTLRRAAETKAVLKELQDDLAASQRVTDLLRDKLYNQSSSLVEARDRIRELEEEKRSSLGEFLQAMTETIRKLELFPEVGIKMEELAKKLASRELETFDILASSAALTTELAVLKQSSEANNQELVELRVIKEESISKLLASQGVINVREKEMVSLKAEVKAQSQTQAELRALLGEAKKLLGEKEVELRAKDPNRDLEFKIKELDTQVVTLKATLHTCQEALQAREIEIQRKVCDVEKLDAELVLSKTTTMKLQDELEDFRSKEASEYEVLLVELRKVLRSQEQALLQSKAELKERLEVQSVGLFQAKEESSKLKTALAVVREQKASADTLVDLHAQRASSAEKAAASIETQLKEAQATVVDLQCHLRQVKAELKLAQEASIISEQTISSTLHERENELEKTIKDLERQNDELSRRSVDILLRYQQGNMTDVEKGFVAHIMKEMRDIHEQSVVAKDNELRRRETMIQVLQGKIADMEMTIARMIKEKESLKQVGPSMVKSVVSLNRWLPESLANTETTIHSPKGQNLVTPTTAVKDPSTAANPSAPLKPSDPKFSRFECLDDEDSEDDIPLSELSRISSGNHYVGLKRPRPPSPLVPEEPIHSKRRTRESVAQNHILPQAPEAPSIPAPVVSSSTKKTMTAVTATAKNRQKKRK